VNDSSRYGFHTVEGEVKNISEGVLHDVEVVVQWYVSSGRLLTSDVALLETTALPAGRTSAFKVLTRSSPAMASYSLVFKAGREVIARFQPSISR
jgi:hypothetical protein